MVNVLKIRRFQFGILNCASSYSSTTSQNIKLERHKKTALKHRTSMSECFTHKLWR